MSEEIPIIKKKPKKKIILDEDAPTETPSETPKTDPTPAPVDDEFADLKIKKKKKKVIGDFEEAPAPKVEALTPAKETEIKEVKKDKETGLEDEFGDLKLKKKKKKVVFDEEADDAGSSTPKVSEATAPAPTGDDDGEIKIKKKKNKKVLADDEDPSGGSTSKKADFDLEAFEAELSAMSENKDKEVGVGGGSTATADLGDDGSDIEGNEDLDVEPEGDNVFNSEGKQTEESEIVKLGRAQKWLKEKEQRDYSYEELLGRFYVSLYTSHPALNPLSSSGAKKYTLAPPQVFREGNKRSVFSNVSDICKKMHRPPEHVIQFLFAELGTTGSVDGRGQLVIKGRFQGKQIENVLRRYIIEYVTCKICRSPDTVISKQDRITFVTCNTCNSRRSVSAIKTGYQAQIGKRVKVQ